MSAQPVAREAFQHQIRDGIDFQIEITHLPYVTSEIFERYIDNVLIPAVESNRELPSGAKKLEILFCDNCSAHMSAFVLQKLACHGILVITYPPHTSHMFQVLSVLRFGLFKRQKKFQMRGDGRDAHVGHVLRLYRAYETVTANTMIRAAWKEAGLDMRTGA
jgi:hypothetical protein